MAGERSTAASRLARAASAPRAVEPRPAAARLKAADLATLQAFDAAVRLGSFKAAAAALRLTPSAVSHRITSLERALGKSLFARGHRVVRPTAAGTALAVATGRAFADLARAVAPVEGPGARRRLRLAALPFFASDWLIPRVGRFMAAHPEIELVIETSNRHADLEVEAFDAAIRVGDGGWPDVVATRLMELRAVPVATAALRRRSKLRRPADLADATLIHVTTFPLAWPIWLAGAGAAGLAARTVVWVDSFGAAMQLAEQHAGVALGLEPLFSARERTGSGLKRLFERSEPTGGYWLVHRRADAAHPGLRAFKRWLMSEIAADK